MLAKFNCNVKYVCFDWDLNLKVVFGTEGEVPAPCLQ